VQGYKDYPKLDMTLKMELFKNDFPVFTRPKQKKLQGA
jgi:hypothetical protein